MSYLYIKQKGKIPLRPSRGKQNIHRPLLGKKNIQAINKFKRCLGIEKAAHSIQVFINVFVILYRGKLQWTRKLNAPADHSQ